MLASLSPYERAWFDTKSGRHNVPRATRLPAMHRMAELAPGSRAEWSLAVTLGFQNRPREAVGLLDLLGHQRKWNQYRVYWTIRTHAILRLGEYERALESAQRCRELFPEAVRCLSGEAKALASLGRAAEFAVVMDQIRAAPDVWDWPAEFVDPVEFFLASGNVDVAVREAERSIDRFESSAPDGNFIQCRHDPRSAWRNGLRY